MADAWQHEESFAVTNAHMLDADVLCDVTFLAGEEKQEVRCHRFMLASRSPVFYTMFCGSLPEAGVVEIPDVKADVFRTIVRFMYTGEIQLVPDSVMATMYAAKKYDIQPLTNRCKTFLEKEITVDNVCIILDQALKFEEKDLIQRCKFFVSEHTCLVFQSDAFLVVSSGALRLLLEAEKETPILPPEDVYASCKRWAKQACFTSGNEVTIQALRRQLGDLILLVDFARMTLESYADNVVQEDILSDKEKVMFLTGIRQRQKTEGKSFFVERFSEKFIQSWYHNGYQCGISFKTSKDVVLCSVALYLPFEMGDLTGALEILEDQTVVFTQNVTLSYKQNEKYENIPLPNKVNIRPGVIYSVHQRLKGAATYFGNTYKGKQLFHGVEVDFMNLHAGVSTSSTNLNRGQILGLTFKII